MKFVDHGNLELYGIYTRVNNSTLFTLDISDHVKHNYLMKTHKSYINTHTHTHTYTHKRTHARTHIHTHKHTPTHTRTYTHTHTHTHSY